ncbi:hypothetical protein M8C21_003632, partial [Ambrosia artemisiifolia]
MRTEEENEIVEGRDTLEREEEALPKVYHVWIDKYGYPTGNTKIRTLDSKVYDIKGSKMQAISIKGGNLSAKQRIDFIGYVEEWTPPEPTETKAGLKSKMNLVLIDLEYALHIYYEYVGKSFGALIWCAKVDQGQKLSGFSCRFSKQQQVCENWMEGSGVELIHLAISTPLQIDQPVFENIDL